MTAIAASGWLRMDAVSRYAAGTLKRSAIPTDPGVYAWYRQGRRVYVGKASCLQRRIGSDHLGRGFCLTGSAFRRNVAEHLGIASANDIKARRRLLTRGEVNLVCKWISGCAIAWVICDTESDAVKLENEMKAEFMPMLTKV